MVVALPCPGAFIDGVFVGEPCPPDEDGEPEPLPEPLGEPLEGSVPEPSLLEALPVPEALPEPDAPPPPPPPGGGFWKMRTAMSSANVAARIMSNQLASMGTHPVRSLRSGQLGGHSRQLPGVE